MRALRCHVDETTVRNETNSRRPARTSRLVGNSFDKCELACSRVSIKIADRLTSTRHCIDTSSVAGDSNLISTYKALKVITRIVEFLNERQFSSFVKLVNTDDAIATESTRGCICELSVRTKSHAHYPVQTAHLAIAVLDDLADGRLSRHDFTIHYD